MAELPPNAQPVSDPAGEILRQLRNGDRLCNALTEYGLYVHATIGILTYDRETEGWARCRKIWIQVTATDYPKTPSVVSQIKDDYLDEPALREAIESCIHRLKQRTILETRSSQ